MPELAKVGRNIKPGGEHFRNIFVVIHFQTIFTITKESAFMKNPMLYCLLFLSLMGTAASAQKMTNQTGTPDIERNPVSQTAGINLTENSILDTLYGSAFSEACGGTVTAINSSGWGFISGMNDYLDLEKAQRISLGSGSFTVQEVWGFFVYASQVGNGNLRAKIYASTPGGAPAALLATSNDIQVDDIDTAGIAPTIFTFPTAPVVSGGEIFVSIDFSDLYASEDTVGLWISGDGCGDGADAYELWEDGTSWYSFDDPSSWGAEVNLLIGVVVEDGSVSTASPLAMNGLQVFPAAPNPATDDIRISYHLSDASEVQIQIIGANGQVVETVNKGLQYPGEFMETLRLGHLPNGVYSYSIVTEKARLMDKFVVQR